MMQYEPEDYCRCGRLLEPSVAGGSFTEYCPSCRATSHWCECKPAMASKAASGQGGAKK